MNFQNWFVIVVTNFRELWLGLTGFIWSLLGALVVFIIGWLIAAAVAQVVSRLVGVFKVDRILERMGLKPVFEKAGLRLDTAAFVGWLVKWFLILIAFMAATDILGLEGVTDYLGQIIGFIPQLIVAVLILLVAVLLGDLADRVVVSSVKAAELRSAEALGKVSRWAIYVVAVLAALFQLGIARELLLTLFTGLIAMVAIAGGLAFGFGGQGLAKEILEKIKKDISGE